MLVKCQACGVKDTDRKDMENIPQSGKNNYFHKGDCYEKAVAHAEFKKKENEELDELNAVIIEVHGMKVPSVPKNFWSTKIQPLRNGESFLYKGSSKRYKEGFTYKDIAETYRFCQKQIREGIARIRCSKKPFDGLVGELNYGFAIVVDKIQAVKRRQERRERQRLADEARAKNVEENQKEFEDSMEREVSFKKKKQDDGRVADISRFL